MEKMEKGKNICIIIFIVLMCFLFIGFILSEKGDDLFSDPYLYIISSTENKVFDNEIKEYARKNKLNIQIEYADTLDIMDKINAGSYYDAIWTSNSIWLYQIDSKVASITNSKSTSINPIVFGIKKSKAKELGFVDKDVYMKDIIKKIESKELKFAMSNPTSTNSGASAYLGILSTLAGNPEILTTDILNNQSLKNRVRTFFTGLSRTSGSEDFLEEIVLSGEYEAVIAYESSIININTELVSLGKEPFYAVYPLDGVSISDSVLAYIDNKDDSKKEAFLKLQNYILSNKGQDLLASYGRRTWYGGTSDNADKKMFNPDWGIDTTKYITPIKYPSTSVIKEALMLYQDELRKPVHVVFCLDYSGSMIGDGISELLKSMEYILSEDASDNYIQFSYKDKIDVIPFASEVGTPWSTSNGKETTDLYNHIANNTVSGYTALHPAAINALKLLSTEDSDTYNLSIILMTDGLSNVGSYSDLEKEYKSIGKNIPIYSIMFGNAYESELLEISNLTNGKVFDGKKDLVAAFKMVRGYN